MLLHECRRQSFLRLAVHFRTSQKLILNTFMRSRGSIINILTVLDGPIFESR